MCLILDAICFMKVEVKAVNNPFMDLKSPFMDLKVVAKAVSDPFMDLKLMAYRVESTVCT